jgi:hypothetical protein
VSADSDAARTRLRIFQTNPQELPMISTEERLASQETTLTITLITLYLFSHQTPAKMEIDPPMHLLLMS